MAKSMRKSGKAVTAEDVARRGRFAHDGFARHQWRKNVRATTREAVLAAVKELNYAPNLAAKSLASAEQPRLGLLYANPSAAYLSEFLVGMLDEIGSVGAQLTLVHCEAGNALAERAAVRKLIGGQISGLLLPPPLSDSPAVRQEAVAAGVPTVAVATGRFHGDFSCIRIDDHKAAYDMTKRILNWAIAASASSPAIRTKHRAPSASPASTPR